jgi:3-dehydroquinate dehydratase-2
MANILVLHGPNLNLLGSREPELYGNDTLSSINTKLTVLATQLGHSLSALQSNAEAVLIERIHACRDDNTDFIIINPAAFTHTSIALRDALLAVAKPFIEVHLSNIYRREPFRHCSYFSDIAIGTLTGLGPEGYLLGLRYAHSYLNTQTTQSGVNTLWT